MHTIYTIGYTGQTPETIKREVERLDAVLVDIRYTAWSRAPEWRVDALRNLVGSDNYLWVRPLGNVNYRNGGPIQLANPTVAVPTIRDILQHRPVVLLCACKNWQTCHRKQAANYLAAALGAPVEHLMPQQPRGEHELLCLSLKQPWASLVVLGEKRYETRSWGTAVRGRIGIHASAGFLREDKRLYYMSPFFRGSLDKIAAVRAANDPSALPVGVILGTVEVVDCQPTDVVAPTLSYRELRFGDYSYGRYAWHLANPVVFETPIPAHGRLRFWPYDLSKGAQV